MHPEIGEIKELNIVTIMVPFMTQVSQILSWLLIELSFSLGFSIK